MKVYHYSRCSTCRKALKWLDTHGIKYTLVDIVESPPSQAVLKQVLKSSGLPVARLFNTSGEVYRQEGYKDKLKNMSEADALSALAANGKLIKRPLISDGQLACVGFDESVYRARFL
jgi:arsenate reductase (glutaredoxin)